MKPLLLIGSYLSPYVRKVLLCLEIKGLAYEVAELAKTLRLLAPLAAAERRSSFHVATTTCFCALTRSSSDPSGQPAGMSTTSRLARQASKLSIPMRSRSPE